MNTTHRNLGAIALAAMFVSACASGAMNTRPENIPTLEQQARANPSDDARATSLGIAYYNAKRYADARATLGKVVADGTKEGSAYLYLGLTNEELKDWAGAREAYEKYVATGPSGDLKEQVRGRLAMVARQQLRQDAKVVLERESQMSTEPPTPRTVAVMPFQLVGTGEELAPLQTALSDMIITDLSVSPAITSVERVKINAMINEMLLTQAGLAESETGARVGRLLKAENVVQGVLAQSGAKQLRLDATVLNTVRKSPAGTFGQNQQVDAIFDLEKAIVFNVFNTIGVTLTASEREKINENRTASLVAFLAYGRGLNELDRGNYQQASTFFRQATQLDPKFERAKEQQTEATALQDAAETPTSDFASAILDAATSPAFAAPTESQLLPNMTQELNGSGADNIPGAGNGAFAPPPTPPAVTNGAQNTTNPGNSTGQTGGVTQSGKATIVITINRPPGT